MRRVDFNPESLRGELRRWWQSWSAEADRAAAEVLADWQAHREVELRPEIWSALKKWLLKHVFHGKCAYCEGRYTAGSFNDAEHWRPKNKVTVKRANVLEVVRCGDRDHPGYFWLAYDWRNLLPACELCNRANGKMNQFPVARKHGCDPGTDFAELDRIEKPYLLHPYFGDLPREHIEFLAHGVVRARKRSERGRHSIQVFHLDRGELEEERAERQEEAERAFGDALIELLKRGVPIEESMANYTGPGARYSEAVKDHLARRQNELMRQFLRFSRHLSDG